MSLPAVVPLPSMPGSYRWYYADVVAGDTTAVFILLLGSPFSSRYAARAARGALPAEHCGVNFALYQAGSRRQWVMTEHARASAAPDELRIGDSTLTYRDDGSLEFFVRERTAPFGAMTKAVLTLSPEVPPAAAQTLVDAHAWAPLALRARATLRLPLLNLVFEGRGYHDMNQGERPLGVDLPGWHWTRAHLAGSTHVDYRLPGGDSLRVSGSPQGVLVERCSSAPVAMARTAWGLKVPRTLRAGPLELPSPRLLESSPFYARLEAGGADAHLLGEVADFRRLRSPLVRWMARLRTRVEAPA